MLPFATRKFPRFERLPPVVEKRGTYGHSSVCLPMPLTFGGSENSPSGSNRGGSMPSVDR